MFVNIRFIDFREFLLNIQSRLCYDLTFAGMEIEWGEEIHDYKDDKLRESDAAMCGRKSNFHEWFACWWICIWARKTIRDFNLEIFDLITLGVNNIIYLPVFLTSWEISLAPSSPGPPRTGSSRRPAPASTAGWVRRRSGFSLACGKVTRTLAGGALRK